MQIDLSNQAQPQDDPEGHVGPKTVSGSPQVNPEGHIGPKMDPLGHIGPKITPASPISLSPIPHGTSSSFTLTITNLNDTAQDWTWHWNTTTNPVTVNTAPITLQPGAQQTITATVNTAGLTQGNSYSPNLIFTFTQVNLSTTITVQFSVS